MSQSAFHRAIAFVVLTAYAVTGTAVLPALMTLAASMEGSHQVMVAETGHGVHLALRHEEGNFTPEVSDHDSRAARLLVSLCKPDEEGDHLLCSEQITTGAGQGSAYDSRLVKEPREANVMACWLLFWLSGTQNAVLELRCAGRQDACNRTAVGPPLHRTVQLLI